MGLLSAPSAHAAGTYNPSPAFQEGVSFIEQHGGACDPGIQPDGSWSLQGESCRVAEVEIDPQRLVTKGLCTSDGDPRYPWLELYTCWFDVTSPTPHSEFHECEAGAAGSWLVPWTGVELHFATLAECLSARLPPPVARCDAYWAKPRERLEVGAPGVLANDSNPLDIAHSIVVDRVNFGVRDHPYALEKKSGALRFLAKSTPGGKPFVAVIAYHLVAEVGPPSNQAKIKIYVQASRPPASLLQGCGGKDDTVPGHGKGKSASRGKLPYSVAGVCGLEIDSQSPRCHILIGGATVRALKKHKARFSNLIRPAIEKAIGKAAERAVLSRARNALVIYTLRKLAGQAAAVGFSGFSLGKMLGKIASAAIIARRWADLESPGYPHKCFQARLTYADSAPEISVDPIHSFVRAWDFGNPPSYRPITTSMAHWESADDVNASLPLFCRGAGAEAVTLGSSSGLPELLDPPYVKFSIDFNR